MVTGLTNGDSYTFTVTATNGQGTGAPSAPSTAAIPTTVPDPPANVLAVAGDQVATVSWTNPSANGSPITGYTVTATDTTNPANGGQVATGPGGPIAVGGLTDGDSYTFTVAATNSQGTGVASAPSAPVMLVTVPDPPSEVLAVPDGNDPGALQVYFFPGFDDGSPITAYTVTASDQSDPGDPTNGSTVSGAASPITVDGLTPGDTYAFTVTATNGVGTGAASTPSAGIALTYAPGAPTGVQAAPDADSDPGVLQVSFSPGPDGGSAITGYAVNVTDLSDPDDPTNGRTASGAASPITVQDLTSGDLYSFTVTATNGTGTGPPSVASSGVSPP